jgi:hypothetical protein
MKYIIFSKNSGGVQIEKELREEGEDVLLVNKSDFQSTIKGLENIEDKSDYLIILDFQDNELYDELIDAGFEVKVELDDEIEEEIETINDVEKIKEEVEDDQYEVGFKKILSTVESLRKDIVDPNPIVKKTKEEINKTLDSLRGILADIEKKQDFDSHTLNNFKQSLSTLESKGKVTNDDLGKLSKGFDNLLNIFEKDKKELTNKISECSSSEDLAKTNKELAILVEDVAKIWVEIKKLFNLYGDGKQGDGYIVQGTTRLSLFLAGVSLNDVFNELNFVAGTGISLTSALNTTTRQTDLTISAPGSTTDEKVKYDASDPTAGYLGAKVVAGEGITISEGTGTDANKVKISNTWMLDPVEEYWDITDGLPVDPEVGDRYISDGTDEELGWYDGYVYEWDGEEWEETLPLEGMMVWLIFEMVWWVFMSGGWREVGWDSYVALDQTIPQTFTGGALIGTGLLSVTAGQLGLDTSTYLTAETDPLSLHLDQTTPQTVINGYPRFSEGLLSGNDSNKTDFPKATAVFSAGDSGHTYAEKIAIVGESIGEPGVQGIGVGGVARTNGYFPGIGVFGRGLATNSDAGGSVGVQGEAVSAHAGGSNVAFKADAQNGAINYSFYGVNGNIYNNGIITGTSLVTDTGGITIKGDQDIRPSVDSTTAINIAQADGTDFVTFDTTNKRVGIGTTAPSTKLHVISTTEQLRLGYDASNYLSATVASNNTVTLANAVAADININCGTDKTLVLGESVWDDIIIPASNLRGGVSVPNFSVFQNGVYQLLFINNQSDEVYGSFEIPHDYKEETDLQPHIHWSPNSTNTGNCVWNFEYTIADASTTFGATTTTTITQAGSGTINQHQLANTAAVISGSGIKVGAICVFRLARPTGDAFTGDAFLHSVGVHYQIDTIGSRQITTK